MVMRSPAPGQPLAAFPEPFVGGVQVQHLAVTQGSEAGVAAVTVQHVPEAEPLVDPVNGDGGVNDRRTADGDLGVGPVHGGL